MRELWDKFSAIKWNVKGVDVYLWPLVVFGLILGAFLIFG